MITILGWFISSNTYMHVPTQEEIDEKNNQDLRMKIRSLEKTTQQIYETYVVIHGSGTKSYFENIDGLREHTRMYEAEIHNLYNLMK